MHDDLVNLGWTEDHLSRIRATVTEEAQRARVLAQALPLSGPEDGGTIALPGFAIASQLDPARPVPPPQQVPSQRLFVDSTPDLPITTIGINVQLRSHEVADPALTAALVMFRRAANYIARIEDALIVNGRLGPNLPPPIGVGGIPPVYTVHGDGNPAGLVPAATAIPVTRNGPGIVNAVVQAINRLDSAGYGAPFACLLGQTLFAISCNPTGNLVLPRDRILPFLQGPLSRSSAFAPTTGAVVSLSGEPLEIIVASDIGVRYLQASLEPRYVFRVSERVALRVKEANAIVHLI